MEEDKKKDEIAVIEINEEFMKQKLYEFRGCKVLLDADLAEVYGYELKAFNQQVKRNIQRFQNDMMFQLSDDEKVFLCGASSKDAGARITSIVEDYGIFKYAPVIAPLLKNPTLILPQ